MDETRSSTPEAPPQDLWSSILDSASSSRSIPSKQILILGQPSSGKSTLSAALLQKPIPVPVQEASTDFALGYDFADVRDEGDEDTLARLSVYTVPSSSSSYTGLLPHFLPPRSALPHTLVMIVLDWTRPWTFIDELRTWLRWVEDWVEGDGSRELQIVREESRDRLQWHLQHYTEPSADSTTPSNTLSGAVLPLGQGTFTQNQSGVPIIVVCTKGDLIDDNGDLGGPSGMGGMVKGKGDEWEERTDGILQVLRTICLKYGASLFYTTPLPATLQVLRQYALHLLSMPPAPPPGALPGTDGTTGMPRNPFPFLHKPNTLDRDRIVVPSGWDSWGKIVVLRDGFEPKLWGEAWELDLPEDSNENGEDGGAIRLYRALVPDLSTKPPSLPAFNNPIPEQTFLAKHYDENAKKPDRDPRGAFRNPAELTASAAGVVGPMGSSSFNLPSVEKVWQEMEKGIGTVSGASSSLGASTSGRQPPSRSARPTGLSALNSTTNPASSGSRPPPSPGPITGSPTGQTQHEVLQNFFQSLLSSKDRAGAAASLTKPAAAPPKTNGTDEGSS